MDGVDQLNNILIIGMTNRRDMIDEALLRPGRLEVHVEISLPDEHGRLQILAIHTAKMTKEKVMDRDVSLPELAAQTKNFSGAEIEGLVKSATSFAFQRHIKVGTTAGISNDVENLRVNRNDFMLALEEVHPAFGVSEEELQGLVQNGIIHYDESVEVYMPPVTRFPFLTTSDRVLWQMPGYSWNKSGRQQGRLSSLCYCMVFLGPEKLHLQLQLRRIQTTHLSSSSLPTKWLDSPSSKKYRQSPRYSMTVINRLSVSS